MYSQSGSSPPSEDVSFQIENILCRENVGDVSYRYRIQRQVGCKRAIEQKATATVFQYITTRVFRDIIKSKFELEKDDAHSHSHMTLDEENALRYVSAWICVSEGTEEN